MKRIGILGGTFNPIHNGHLIIAERAKAQFALEKVLFLPSGVPYKKDLRDVLPAQTRCEMTAAAIADSPYFELSDLEAADEAAGKNTYTCKTLQTLRRMDPEAKYFFILGADSLFDLEHWKCPEIIFRNCTILAAVRGGAAQTADRLSGGFLQRSAAQAVHPENKLSEDVLQQRLKAQAAYLRETWHADIALLDVGAIDISSTQLRQLIRAGESIQGLVPEAVEAYIRKHHLYES